MYRDTVTVFTRQAKKSGDLWHPSILTGVDFNADRARMIAQYGEGSSDSASLHIRYTVTSGNIMIGKLQYVEPKVYEGAVDTITFNAGNTFDFFMLGDYGSTDVIRDDAYTKGFYDYIHRICDNIFALTKVARYSVIPHFEILGK